jgi:transposase
MIRLRAQVRGLGIETADIRAHEAFSRSLRDRRAVAGCGWLTGVPDESGARRREKSLAKTGNTRVRHDPAGLALSDVSERQRGGAHWYRARTADARGATLKALIIALARKVLVALWRLVTTGEVPHGVVLRPAS